MWYTVCVPNLPRYTMCVTTDAHWVCVNTHVTPHGFHRQLVDSSDRLAEHASRLSHKIGSQHIDSEYGYSQPIDIPLIVNTDTCVWATRARWILSRLQKSSNVRV